MILIHQTSIDHLLDTSWDPATIEAYCKICKNYNVHFSCPHHDFHIPDFLRRYDHVLVAAHAIPIDQTQPGTLEEHFYSNKTRLDQQLLSLENMIPESQALIAGQCQNCQSACELSQLSSCPKPDLLRYSFESLGFDVAALLKLYFDKELTFNDQEVILVYGFLLSKPLDKDQLAFVKGQLDG